MYSSVKDYILVAPLRCKLTHEVSQNVLHFDGQGWKKMFISWEAGILINLLCV